MGRDGNEINVRANKKRLGVNETEKKEEGKARGKQEGTKVKNGRERREGKGREGVSVPR